MLFVFKLILPITIRMSDRKITFQLSWEMLLFWCVSQLFQSTQMSTLFYVEYLFLQYSLKRPNKGQKSNVKRKASSSTTQSRDLWRLLTASVFCVRRFWSNEEVVKTNLAFLSWCFTLLDSGTWSVTLLSPKQEKVP